MLDKRLKKVSFVVVASLMFYFSFSKFDIWFLILPFLFLLTLWKDLKAWLITGFLSIFASLFWIKIAMVEYGGVFPPVAYLLIALLALSVATVQFGGTYLLWKLSRYNLLVLPFAWTAMEVLRSIFPYGGFPWLLVGELSVNAPFLKDYLSAGGVYLCSLLLWILALTPYSLRSKLFPIVAFLSFLIPVPFIERDFDKPGHLKVAIVQPNVREDIKLNKEAFYEYLPRYWELLEAVMREEPDIVILPESAFPFHAGQLYERGEKLLEYSRKATIVTGLIDVRVGEDIEPYNSVFVIKNGEVIDFYDKIRLLPFGEYVPFPFHFAKDLFGSIGGIDYVPGSEPRCVNTGNVSVATPICFEVSYYLLVKRLSSCADFIAVITNDGWFEDSDGTYQHLRQARVRAVENRKFLLWVNNTGPSAVISPSGEIVKEIPYGRKGFIVFEF